jgi:SNF2 family DNA or RNA helicase
MQPYVYQVTKDECLDLPDKLYHTHYVKLSDDQKEAYQRVKDDFCQYAERHYLTGEVDRMAIFHLFTSLQSIVCGFWNYNKNWAFRRRPRIMKHERYEHERIDSMWDLIDRVPSGEKIIIWCKYRYCLDQIEQAISKEWGKDSVVLFYGGLSPKKREDELRRFRADAKFFVATQSCGGQGLTLNEANHVIFYAEGFKYSDRIQAEDRCHRIGQTKRVTYMTLRSESGIEDSIADSLRRKSNVLDDFRCEIEKIKREGSRDKLRELIMKL